MELNFTNADVPYTRITERKHFEMFEEDVLIMRSTDMYDSSVYKFTEFVQQIHLI